MPCVWPVQYIGRGVSDLYYLFNRVLRCLRNMQAYVDLTDVLHGRQQCADVYYFVSCNMYGRCPVCDDQTHRPMPAHIAERC